MDGYRSREHAASVYESEQRYAAQEKANSFRMYKAVVVNIDEDKVFADPENLRSICRILGSVENDMLYLDRKELKERGLSFTSDSNGDPAYFEIYYDCERPTDISAVKTKYLLIDRLVENYRSHPQQFEPMLYQAAAALPEETLVVLGNNFNNGLLSDEMLQTAAKALRGESFTEIMRQKTPETFYIREDYEKSKYVFPLFEHLLEKDMLNEEQAYILKRLCVSPYHYGRFDLSKTKQLLDEKWGTHLLPRNLWRCEDLSKDSPAVKYNQAKDWGFANEHDKLEMIYGFQKAFYSLCHDINNPEREPVLSYMTKDIVSRLDENNPIEVLAWLQVPVCLNRMETKEDALKLGQWILKQLPENKNSVFRKTIEYANKSISEKISINNQINELNQQCKGGKEIGRVFSENTFNPRDAYCFVYTDDYVISHLTSSDSHQFYADGSETISSKGKTYQAFGLGRTGYQFLIDLEKMTNTKQSSITLCVPKDAIGTVIGKGGKNIKALGEKFRKNFKVVEMPADEAAPKKQYSFKPLNETQIKYLQDEINVLTQKRKNRETAEELLSTKIKAFAPSPETPNKEELWAQYVVSQIVNNHGEVTNLPDNIINVVKQISNRQLTSDTIRAERKTLSDQIQKVEEEQERRLKEEIARQEKQEREKHLAAIADNILNQWGDELPSMKEKTIINSTHDYINANREKLPIELESHDFASLCNTLIDRREKKLDEMHAEKIRQEQEKLQKINEYKNKILVEKAQEPEPKPDSSTVIPACEDISEPEETPREMTAAEKEAEKAKLKLAKKNAAKTGGKQKTIKGDLSALASLLGGNNGK